MLWPALEKFLPNYPDIKVEINLNYGMTDIVADRFDAGIRLGDQVAKDMIAVRISPDLRMTVVGSPSYFARRSPPLTPGELTQHDCINIRLPTYGGLLVWDFEKDGQSLNVRTDGQLIFNSSTPRLRAALAGFGLAFLPEDVALEHVARRASGPGARRLVPALLGLPHLLSQPAPVLACVRAARRCLAL